MQVQVQYDPEADAVYVDLGEAVGEVTTDRIDERRLVDYDEREQVVGVEFLFVSQGIDLVGIPEAPAIAEALRKFRQLQVSPAA